MKTKRIAGVLGGVLMSLFISYVAKAQGFINLDFESPTFVPVASPYQGSVNPSNALPGWTAYWGSSLAPYALYDNYFLDTRGISIFDGNEFSKSAPLQGQYSLLLQGGFTFPPNRESASVAQTGLIPSSAKSLTFQLGPTSESFLEFFEVSVAGQALQQYGGAVDISPFAGQVAEIRFTAYPHPAPGLAINNIILDRIAFSQVPVPEPSVFAFASLVGIFLLVRLKN